MLEWSGSMSANARIKSNNLLQIEHLTFSYEEQRRALDDVSLVIHAGERIAVLGENGAGKSTFFLNLNGVRVPDSGRILLKGEEITKKNRTLLHKEVGIVFQDADNQIIASTVKAEIAFGPMNMGVSRPEVEERTRRAMEEMDLSEYAGRPPHYLSGGEKKRVSIADIIAMDSSVVIFDEPTASLDPENAAMLEAVLDRLQKAGKTILLSTHDVDFAYRFAERILVFSGGHLIADDTPDNIFLDEELLRRSHLKQPLLMQVTKLLEEKNLLKHLPQSGAYPKDIAALEELLL
jgi:cobalt/nickel transport system ATP-binding protein